LVANKASFPIAEPEWQLPQPQQTPPAPVANDVTPDSVPEPQPAKAPKQRKQKKSTQNSGANTQEYQQYQAVQKQEPPVQATKELNTDAKIASLEELVAKDLSIIESKAHYLKSLQEELRTVKAERDTQINMLNTEKTDLLAKREELEKELIDIQHRVTNISLSVTQLQQEKDQKIKILEERYSSAIETEK